MEATPGIAYTKEGCIGIIRFNNPPLNLGTNGGLELLEKILADIEADQQLRAVILCAAGKVFSAGSDMKEIGVHLDKGTYVTHKMEAEIRLRTRLSMLPVPTIAALDGSAYGGGFDWALSCDMRVAAPHIVLSLPEVNIGSFPGSGSAYRLTRLIGAGKAMQFMLFAKQITAQQALELSIVNEIAADGTAYELAYEWANEIASKSGTAVRAIKEAVSGIFLPSQQGLDELQMHISHKVSESADFREGMEAFFEKRSPQFEGNEPCEDQKEIKQS